MCQAKQVVLPPFWRGVSWGQHTEYRHRDSNLVWLQCTCSLHCSQTPRSSAENDEKTSTDLGSWEMPILRAQSICVHWLVKCLWVPFHKSKQANQNPRGRENQGRSQLALQSLVWRGWWSPHRLQHHLTLSKWINILLQGLYITGESGHSSQILIIFTFTNKVLEKRQRQTSRWDKQCMGFLACYAM